MDSSKSIGMRFSRADEIVIPWALTVDHTSLEDGSVTIRRRDDQMQVRAFVDEILDRMAAGTIQELF